jgi:hypothetical protein
MIVFCLSVHHLWGRTLNKHHQDACAVAFADDGYIKAKLSVALEVLPDVKHVLKEDADLDLNFDKTKILVKGISAADVHAAAQPMINADLSLAHLSRLLSPASFVVDGYIVLGVPIGTDAFIQHFVKDKRQAIMEDVDKLDNIQDGFIQYQLIRFCQATRLQYLNGHLQLANQNVLQQQHIDHKITNALLKKGTRDAYKTWNQQDNAWVDMRLHESHDEGGFGVPNNTITRRSAAYTTNTRFVAFLGTFACPAQQVWLPGNDLRGSSHLDGPPLCQLKQMHEDCAAAQPAPPSAGGSAAANAGANPQPQPPDSQGNGHGKLVLPQLNRLHEAFKRSQVSHPASSSSQDQQPTRRPSPIPSQRLLTQQLTKHWPQFKASRQLYDSTRFEEQRQLHLPQKHKATVPESILRVEMNTLEEQADNAKVRDLYWKPLSWLGTIGPLSVNDVFDSNLWATFVSTTIGLVVPSLSSLSLHHNNPLAKCGCKKHYMNFHGDHTSTCTAYSGATKAHDWLVGVLGPIFRTAGHTVRTQHGVKASAGQRRGDVAIRRYLQDAAGRRSLVHLFFPRHHEHKHTHVLRVFASSFSTGPPGNRSAFHCSGM